MFNLLVSSFILSLVGVNAETHTIFVENECGYGTPTLIQGSSTLLSTGDNYTVSGPLIGVIAYLQTGACGLNGENCTVVEASLSNPNATAGSGSTADVSLVPPYAYSVTTGFYNGCDGIGQDCTSPSCIASVGSGTFPVAPSRCAADDVNLAVTFCD